MIWKYIFHNIKKTVALLSTAFLQELNKLLNFVDFYDGL